MLNNIREELLKLKEEYEIKYVSFFNNGTTCEDNTNDVLNRKEDKLKDYSNIDTFLKDNIRRLFYQNTSFDKVEYGFKFGIIFEKETLGENNEILPTSKSLDNKVRFYTENVKAYKNNELVNKLSESIVFPGYQGYLDYNTFVKDTKKSGLVLVGPQSFEELKELILSGNYQDISISIDFTKKNEIEEVPVIETKEEVQEEKVFQKKKHSLFRK